MPDQLVRYWVTKLIEDFPDRPVGSNWKQAYLVATVDALLAEQDKQITHLVKELELRESELALRNKHLGQDIKLIVENEKLRQSLTEQAAIIRALKRVDYDALTTQLAEQMGEIAEYKYIYQAAGEHRQALMEVRDQLQARVQAMRSALEFASKAISDAIHLDDGLDGATGEACLRIITEAIDHGTFDNVDPKDLDIMSKEQRALFERVQVLSHLLQRAQAELNTDECDKVRGVLLADLEAALREGG